VSTSIRRAAPSDLPAIMALEKRAATAAHWSIEQYNLLFSAAASKRIALVIAEAGNEERFENEEPFGHSQRRSDPQGFVIARTLDEEWEIENIAINDSARRRGLGSRLLGALLEMARTQGARRVFLEVRESNPAARALYRKCGLVESGRRPRYYRNPEETAVLYRIDFA
jgi:ribosomal-protein-alanine acetyltransferase